MSDLARSCGGGPDVAAGYRPGSNGRLSAEADNIGGGGTAGLQVFLSIG
jgi:hypothetical protein